MGMASTETLTMCSEDKGASWVSDSLTLGPGFLIAQLRALSSLLSDPCCLPTGKGAGLVIHPWHRTPSEKLSQTALQELQLALQATDTRLQATDTGL